MLKSSLSILFVSLALFKANYGTENTTKPPSFGSFSAFKPASCEITQPNMAHILVFIKGRSHLRHVPPQPLLNTEHSLQVVQLLFIIATDCSTLNPGPVKNSCDLCRKIIRKNQNVIECEKCLSWFHQKCMNMSDAHFKVLAEHPSYMWLCCTCGLPSFSSSLFLSEIGTSNKYVLSDSTHCSKDLTTDSQPTVWSPGPPLQSSSHHIFNRGRGKEKCLAISKFSTSTAKVFLQRRINF